jgi:DNA-binding CsgD family transcriptional regulator
VGQEPESDEKMSQPEAPTPKENPVQQHEDPDYKVTFSTRERAILLNLARGASNALIARELNVAEATIKVDLRSLLRRIQASNRTRDHGPDVTPTQSENFPSSFAPSANAEQASSPRSGTEVPSVGPDLAQGG